MPSIIETPLTRRLQPADLDTAENHSEQNFHCQYAQQQQQHSDDLSDINQKSTNFYKHLHKRRKYLPPQHFFQQSTKTKEFITFCTLIIIATTLPAFVLSNKYSQQQQQQHHSYYDHLQIYKDLLQSPLASSSLSSLSSSQLRNKRETLSALYSSLPSARSGNSAIYFGSNNVNSNEILYSVDNRKPAFKNCAGYKPSVKEEQPENTFVLRVEAEDPDPDQEIKYSLVQSAAERPKFRINPSTGVIVTEHTFDRDEPIHEKAVYVTVQATDNGRPPLDDVCTFKVTIEDINDNPPVFNKARYDESMSEDIQVGVHNQIN